MSSFLALKNVSLDYPLYGTKQQSIRQAALKIATGGRFVRQEKAVMVKALDNINFTLKAGDSLGLIGHNGAGKSTLLRVMAQIFEPTSGQVESQGKIAPVLDLSVGIQLEATGYENIRTRGLLMGLNNKQIKALVPEIEAFTGIGNFLSLPMRTYSSGMILRLAFAIATAVVPNILLMDEAVSAGDQGFMEKASQRLERFIQESDILVLASHANDVIKKFCNKVLWLEHGQIRMLGKTEEVMPHYEAHRPATKTHAKTSETQDLVESL